LVAVPCVSEGIPALRISPPLTLFKLRAFIVPGYHSPPGSAASRHGKERSQVFPRRLAPKRNVILEGCVEKRIQVDYFLEGKRGLALEVVNRKHHLVPYMEQWGWRWNDLREKRPNLVRAMVYDPDNQDWEDTALAIGKSVCEFFCPYFETERVHEAIFEASKRQKARARITY
jgi:hypothetical protein